MPRAQGCSSGHVVREIQHFLPLSDTARGRLLFPLALPSPAGLFLALSRACMQPVALQGQGLTGA